MVEEVTNSRRSVLKSIGATVIGAAAVGNAAGASSYANYSDATLETERHYLTGLHKEGDYTNSDYTVWYDSTHKLDCGIYDSFERDSDGREIVPIRISSSAFAEGTEQWGDDDPSTGPSETIAADGLAINVRSVDGASVSDLDKWIGNPSESSYVAVRNSDGDLSDVDDNSSEAGKVMNWGITTLASFANAPLAVTSGYSLVSMIGSNPPEPRPPYENWSPWPSYFDDIIFQSFVTHDEGRSNGGVSEMTQYLKFGLEKPIGATVELDIAASTYQLVCPVGDGLGDPYEGYRCADGSGDPETGGVDTYARCYNIEV